MTTSLRAALLTLTMVTFGAPGCAAEAMREDPAVDEPDDDGRTAEAIHGTMPAGTALVTTANVNLRSGPGRSYSALRVLATGTKVSALGGGATNGFYQVQAGATTGWTHGDYLERVGTTSEGSPPSCTGSFQPPLSCNGPSSSTSKTIPANGLYATSWFGCYRTASGAIHDDPYDNCQFACGNRGLCPSGLSGPECQARLRWFAADADRYGCGARIRVTSCTTGKSAVLVTLDRGPNCTSIEKRHNAPVLDMSHDAVMYLMGAEYGGGDKKRVTVERVPDTTPLGPS